MPNYSHVLYTERVVVPTDVGDLYFTKTYVDFPISVGSRIDTDSTVTGELWQPTNGRPYSIFHYGDTATEFTSKNGTLSLKMVNEVPTLFVYNANGVELRRTPIQSNYERATGLSVYLLIGNNGVPYILESAVDEFYIGLDGTDFVPNTTKSFGSFESSGFYASILGIASESEIEIAKAILSESEDYNDPFNGGGTSGTGGGTGSFDGTGDAIAVPGLPTLSAVDSGFITLFNPTLGQLRSLSSYMWSDFFDLDTLKKLFADPMQAILGLSIVPVVVPNSGTKEVKVGNISTGVTMNVASRQYVTLDCGTLNVNEYWGAYLDYDPYTKAEIYMPYIGTHAIAVDDIMNKPVQVVYNVDLLSGACCAHIKCGDSVLYTFSGQCASQIPVTGNDWGNVINGALSIAGAVGSMVATSGATAPLAVSSIASTAVNSMKSNVEKSGAMGGTGGMLGVQTPYLILTRPRQALPSRQNSFIGYPSFITSKLGDLSGYTEVDTIHLENIKATDAELSEIESLLKGGVIL